MYSDLPSIGVGIGWRTDLAGEIRQNASVVDWCELISEHYIGVTEDKMRQLDKLRKNFLLVPHGVDLSIGTDLPIEQEYVTALDALLKRIGAPWFSDHLCFTRVPGYSIGQLTPLRFCEENVSLVTRKVLSMRSRISTPFLLENISYPFTIPRSEMSEAQFITEVVETADIGLLIDLCNVFINSRNHRYDPFKFLESLPLNRVVQVHLAGGNQINGRWYDSHSYPVHNEVFELLEFLVSATSVKGILLERDSNFPDSFQELADDLCRAREILNRSANAAAASESVARN